MRSTQTHYGALIKLFCTTSCLEEVPKNIFCLDTQIPVRIQNRIDRSEAHETFFKYNYDLIEKQDKVDKVSNARILISILTRTLNVVHLSKYIFQNL